jgi:hypothetical protein
VCLGELWFTATGMSELEAVKLMLLSVAAAFAMTVRSCQSYLHGHINQCM